jgi:hypothetical protein
MQTTRRQRARAIRWAAVLSSVTLLVSACSGDDETSADKDQSSPTASPAEPELVTRTDLGAIAGRLPKAQRQKIRDQATAIVEDYTDWAYLAGDYPRTTWDFPVPGFSARASRRIQRDVKLATNADIGAKIDEVSPVRRRVIVDVLSPGGKPAGLTARFLVVFDTSRADPGGDDSDGEESGGDTGDVKVTVKGRLVMVPKGSKWQVVGHYFSKGASR